MNQLIEIVKLVAEKYPNIDTEIDKDIIRLKFYIEGIEYQTVEIAKGENQKLDVTILLDVNKSTMVLEEVKELILILNKQCNVRKFTKEQVDELRCTYKTGTKIELIRMYDVKAIPPKTKGVIDFLDDLGTIHVTWETGEKLGLVVGVDIFKVIEVNEQ